MKYQSSPEPELVFSRIALVLSASAFISVILAVATMKWWLLASLYPILFVLFASRFMVERPSLSFNREISKGLVVEGDAVEIKVEVVNEGPPLNLVLVSDFVPKGLELVEGNPSHLISLK
ncbi:MAG: hypothetical protein DRO05_01540, partial [Thermoproteota archaeon]